jgi:hypothetical protein
MGTMLRVKVDMLSTYGTYFSQVKEFKDNNHLENWLKWMDSNQDRVKVIGTSEVNKVKKVNMKTHTFKMTRVYETIIEIDAENIKDAFNKLQDMDVYELELEQCNVVHEQIESQDDYALEDKVTGMFINQITK